MKCYLDMYLLIRHATVREYTVNLISNFCFLPVCCSVLEITLKTMNDVTTTLSSSFVQIVCFEGMYFDFDLGLHMELTSWLSNSNA